LKPGYPLANVVMGQESGLTALGPNLEKQTIEWASQTHQLFASADAAAFCCFPVDAESVISA
jgi:hypothetical protein